MEMVLSTCCGMDVHKRQVVACLLSHDEQGEATKHVQSFATTTQGILQLSDWLMQASCTQVAMESTGVYWKPIFNLLEGHCEILLVNAQHIKNVPGRKTDTIDAEWIAQLLRYGLLRGSFVPKSAQRELRDLTRYRRSLVEERTRILNRLQKVLEDTNIKLGNVVSDINGISARAMLEALVAGETDPHVLADLAKGSLRKKREQLALALTGTVRPQHQFILGEYLAHLDFLEEGLERVTHEIIQRLEPDWQTVALLTTIPGVSQRTAHIILAELGRDLTRFPSAEHLASWTGLCPGNHESAGKRYSGKTRSGNPYLRQGLMEAAHAVSRTKGNYLVAQFRRLSQRRGKKRALVALAHSLLKIIYYILKRNQPYQDLGPDYFDRLEKNKIERRLVKRLQDLGYQVTLSTTA